MAAVFQPDPERQPRATATATPQELSTLANRRQQQKVQTTVIETGDTLFPIASAPGTLPNLLGGDDRAESGGVLRAPNVGVVDGVGDRPSALQSVAAAADVPMASDRLEVEPAGVPYAQLTAGQRERALRTLHVDVGQHVVDGEGAVVKVPSGASVVQLNLNASVDRRDDPVFLAEDGVAGQASFVRLMRKQGVPIRAADSYDGYTVGYEVPDERLFEFMQGASASGATGLDSKDGKVYVRFDEVHSANREFANEPFKMEQS